MAIGAKLLALFAVCCFVVPNVLSSHFRGGIIMVRPVSNGYIEITYYISWRRTSQRPYCTSSLANSYVYPGGSTLSCISGCSGSISRMRYVCTDFSSDEDWSFGDYRLNYRFSGSGTVTIGTTGYCWISPFGCQWSLPTTFSLAVRSDTGQINSSPRAITSPVVRIQQGCNSIIALPVSDPDGDVIRCRWASGSSECGGVCGWFPGASLNSETCTITYSGSRTGLLAAAVMIEDYAPGTSYRLSSVGLQFLVYIVGFSGSCGQAPTFIDPTPPQGTCIINTLGTTFMIRLNADSGSSSVSIREIQTASPRGLTKSSVQRLSGTNNYYVDITWRPDSSQNGQTHSFCYAAVNSGGISSNQICIQIMAGAVPPTPAQLVLQPSSVSYRVNFDQDIQRPTTRSYIIFYDFATNAEVYRVDAAAAATEVVFDQPRSILIRPNYSFTSGRRYYFNFQQGVVLSTLGCRPGNNPINGRNYWIISSPPSVSADTNGNTLSAGFGSSVTLRFVVTPAVDRSGIRWTYEDSTVLNSLNTLNGARLSFSSDYYSLTISNVNCNSGGRYRLSASNTAGSDTDYIDLYLVGPPQIKSRANNATVVEGQTATFSFTTCAGPNPSFSWSRITLVGGEPTEQVLPGSNSHVRVNNNMLTVYQPRIADTGEYTYTVTNSYGSAQDNVFLVVSVPLANVVSPSNIAVNQGDSAVMSCEFQGTGISGVTWISPSGAELQNNPPSVTISESGLFYVYNWSSTVEISNVIRTQHEGWYTCRGMTESGQSSQVRAYLTVQVRPTVQSTISERHISELEGERIILTFSILNANPAVTTSQILWYFNGSVALRPLNTLFGNVLVFSNNYRTLTISNINYNIQGRISLVANNVVGGDSDYTDLTIEGSPRFSIVPTNTSASPGNNVTFTCSAFAAPPPAIVWSHTSISGVSRNLAARDNVVINGDTLMIFNVDYFRDGGRYTCTASNTHGSNSVNSHLNLDSCGLGGVDLTFVVDESGSIGETNFQQFRGFIEDVTSVVNVGPHNSQVAVITFDSTPILRFNLDEYADRTSLNQAIRDLPYSAGGTDIAAALNFLRNVAQNGTLTSNPNNRQIAMFMTDGQSDPDEIAIAATSLHATNIFQVYAIGISGANITQLNRIANGDSNRVFYSNTFDSSVLRRIEEEVIAELCTVRFEIATHVTNTSVIQNNNAFLSCEFYGTEIINITWTTSDRSVITSDVSYITIISSSSSTRSSSSLQFTNVDGAQSEGWYTCTAYSYDNGMSQNIITLSSGAYLYVQVPPVVQVVPQQNIFTAFEHQSFQIRFEVLNARPIVTASGITWRFNDQIQLNNLNMLNGAGLSFSTDTRSLTITNVNYNISGLYFFSAFNGAGRASTFITVNVEGIPKFTVAPPEMSVINAGGSITLSCSATAIPQPTITWSRTRYYGTETLSHNSSENIMIDGNVLTVSNVQYYRDNGTYSCIAANSRGSNHSFAEVKVHVPLAISTLPENVTVDNGDSASFTFGVTGSDIVNITWISPSGAVIDATLPDVTLSTNTNHTAVMSSITISNLQRDPSEGWYTCICYAMNRSEIYYVQAQVYLFVQVVPEVRSLQGRDFTVTEGSTAAIQFEIHNANPPVRWFEIVWLYGEDTELNFLPNGTVVDGTIMTFSEDYLTLTFTNITYNISGRLEFSASNIAGQSTEYVDITVHGNPKFTETPENMVVTVGGTALLSCSASAIPTPTITWHRIKNNNATNEMLPGSYGNILFIDNTIAIENVQYNQDEGYYVCRASNSLQTMDAVSFVKVYVPLVLQSAPGNVTVLEGQEATFTCTIDGTDILNATWFSPSGTPLEPSPNIAIVNDITPTGVVTTLRITNIQWPDNHGSYTFQCVAQNGTTTATVQTTAHLHVQVCLFNGLKYEEGHQILSDCTTRCTCTRGVFSCQQQTCAIDGPTCSASGDPHYHTFDSRYFDFQGDCEYVLTQSCNTSDFSVYVTNSGHNSRVSCTDTVRVVIPGENLNILLGRGGGGTVTINNITQPNNGDKVILKSGQVEVVRAGGRPHVILTVSGVKVSWDGLYRVEVTVATSWRGRLCGLCGNYNDDPDDDFISPDGMILSSPDAFGGSWVVGNTTQGSCGGLNELGTCDVMEIARSRCAALQTDPFMSCNNVVSPDAFIADCVYDYCYCNDGDKEDCYCNSLATYASACAEAGVILPNWRESSSCLIECPAGTVYQQCGPLCPQTCDNIGTSNCLGGCAAGCFCPNGQVWYDGNCMDVASCPVCLFNGIQYDEGQHIQPNCSTRCICQDGHFICTPQFCPIVGPSCYAAGDPHYRTFDSRYYDFQGVCEYVLTQPCNSSEFSVIVTNSAHNSRVSCTDTVRVVVPSENLDILLGRGGGGTVMINGIPQTNNGDEVILTSGEVEVVRVGGRPHVMLNVSGVKVSWDGLYHVEVTVRESWSGQLCGLCGNYNGDPNDDFMTPDGLLASSPDEFAPTWLVANTTGEGCAGLAPLEPCPADVMANAQMRCNEMQSNNFTLCNSVLDATSYINDCVYDYCHCNERDRPDCYCNNLAAYASACASNGVVIPNWRRDLMCPLQCSPGMVYQQCGPLCPQTCDNIGTSNCQGGCAEGCFCPDGQVLSEGRCINPIACPVCRHMGVEYEEGDQIRPDCLTHCTCQKGRFNCQPQNCITDGATCYAWGDPHYTTFDSRKFDFQGDCEYVFTQPCNSSEFSVIVSNAAHNSYVSCTDSVRVIVPSENLNILLERGGAVTINDIPQANNGDGSILKSGEVEVIRVGGRPHVLLSVSGVKVSWDGLYRVDVTVSRRWSGKLCGLCGNYNGDTSDEFLTSDNVLVSDPNEFAVSWPYSENNSTTCRELEIPVPCGADVTVEAQTRCAVMREGVFRAGNTVLDPSPFIEACEYDYCYCDITSREECYCNSLSAYAAACSDNGIVLSDWRNSYCTIECPAGMVYQQCGSLCPQTCENVGQGPCSSGCAEGCFCPDGQVLINGVCRHALACPVCTHMGIVYEEGDQIQPNCGSRCVCRNGQFRCQSQPCLLDGATCYASGDPHYRTFDLRTFDFQGTCEYVMAQPCNSSEFSITATNSAHNPYVSCAESVRVVVPNENLEIVLGRRGSVTINDRLQSTTTDSTIMQSDGVTVTRIGGHSRVFLSSGIEIFFDGSTRVTVTVSSAWIGQLCGLCGNYNGDPSDDFQNPEGILLTSPNSFGLSWAVYSDNELCGDLTPPPACSTSIMSEAQERCTILQQEMFAVANSMVDPAPFINDCIYDYCLCNEADREECFCNILANYAGACANNGIVINNWRDTVCAIQCPPGMVYQQCGPRCPQTCDNIGTSNCQGGCAEGCFCPDGQVLSNERCIDPIACPVCNHLGVQYNEGDHISPNCSTRCVCHDRYFQCEPQLCTINGPTCYASGDPHYHTFDMRYYDFQGACEYILSQPCDGMEFSVVVGNSRCNSRATCTYSVRVVVPSENLDILLGRGGGGTVIVNGIPQTNNGDEVILTSGGVEVVRVGGRPNVILIDLGVRISFDGQYRVEVTVSTSWRGRLCGLCGNYNGDPDDDFITPNNLTVTDPNDFGISWLHPSNISTVCQDHPPTPGPCPANRLAEAQMSCSLLRRDTFVACTDLVDPGTFIESCVYDYCYTDDEVNREQYYHGSLAAYASACAHIGVVLPWRNFTNTSSGCPPGMVYQQCGPLCPQTCDNIGISNCHGGCAEGCFCPAGQVISNGRCIEPLTCSECIYMGTRYSQGDMVQPNCSTRCVCNNGQFLCQSQRCITNGATCYAWGDPHYTTFDSRKFDFQGDCEYVLTQPCNSSEFSVLVSNTAHNSRVSCTDSVRVIIPSEDVDILFGRRGAVTINGRLQENNGDELILQAGEVEVLRIGGRPLVLLSRSGVKVSWDGLYRVDVTVSTSWIGRLCGLCGNYNDDPTDDFMTSNNILVTSPNVFAHSWVTNDGIRDTCGGLPPPDLCPADIMATAQQRCTELQREYFSTCNALVNPTDYIQSCVYDYCNCNAGDREDCYCESLAAYARVCTQFGVILQKWRHEFCPIQCPSGMVYQQCGSLCLRTCTNNITSDCHGGCAEGCFCPDGLVLSNGRCVDPIVCPVCRHNGITYEEGDHIQPNCSARCTCHDGHFRCKQQDCRFDGPTCYASGDPHYHTFDMRYFNFQGDCEYILSQPCDTMDFSVIVANSRCNSVATCTYSVRVVVASENLDILLGRGGIVTINGILQANNGDEVILTSGGVEVVRVGGRPHVLLNELGVKITWDGQYRVEVTVSTSWRGRLCGLCGNYNGDPDDDFMTPNNMLASNPNEFGISWLLVSNISTVCQEYPPTPDPCPADIMDIAVERCSVLEGEQFNPCTGVISPTTFVESCIFDYCYSNEGDREYFYQRSKATYAAVCAKRGVVIPNIRNTSSECSPGMVYQQCGPLCPQTCDNVGTLNCQGGCAEGCFCPNGQVQSNRECISPVLCQECSHNGIMYSEGDQIQPNRSARCTCRNGNFICEQQRLTFDGQTCYASGDPHYHTFDMRYFDFQGTCEYILTQSCYSMDFAVIVRNDAHNSRVSCTDAVRVVVPSENLDILLGRGGGGTVTINGLLQANNGDEVILTSGGVEVVRVGGRPHVLLTELGVKVTWDGRYRVEVTVSTSWRGRLCGLCGNFNGDPDDDFMTPNNMLASNPNEFGISWLLVSNISTVCQDHPPTPGPCPADIMDIAVERCSVLEGEQFSPCNDIASPTTFIDSCIFDYCYGNEGDREHFYQSSIAIFAAVCAGGGVVIPISNLTNGSSRCSPGMVYQQCGPLCPQTCDNIGTSNCLGGCAEGCFCPDGQVFLNGRCVNPIACPVCTYMEIEYEEGDRIQPNCSTVCTCRDGYFECEEQICPDNIDPNSTTTATCHAFGGLHYQTFDLRDYEFQGNCTYIFAQTCNSAEFIVSITTATQTLYVYNIQSVNISIANGNTEIILDRQGSVRINGAPQINSHDELMWQNGNVEVVKVGGFLHVLWSAAGINIFWDGEYRLSVTVSDRWSERLCGLCGNYNGNPRDDFTSPNGEVMITAHQFSISWQNFNNLMQSCNNSAPPPPVPCPAIYAVEAKTRCDVLLGTQFIACSRIVDPFPFIDDCYHDYCFCNEEDRQDCYCSSLSTYISICTSHGIILPTSILREFNCSACPAGTVYQHCGSLCPQTCDNRVASQPCVSGCAEGCFCPDGHVLVNGTCAHPTTCPEPEVTNNVTIIVTDPWPEFDYYQDSIASCQPHYVQQVEATDLTVFEGQTVHLECTPAIIGASVRWTLNNTDISPDDDNNNINLTPEGLHHQLVISQPTVVDSGVYVCYINTDVGRPALKTTTLTVVPVCHEAHYGGLLWRIQSANQMARLRCSEYHPSFQSGVYIGRMCNSNGEWEDVDFTNCTMDLDATPFIAVEVQQAVSNMTVSTDVLGTVSNQVHSILMSAGYNIIEELNEIFEENGLLYVEVLISVAESTLKSDVIDRVRQVLSAFEDVNVTGFQPSRSCFCPVQVNKNVINQLCVGPSVPVCSCVHDSCQCTSPSYSGNGTICGLDSDSDGYPDVQLDCTSQYCEQDVCPDVYSTVENGQQDVTRCNDTAGSILEAFCVAETDAIWNTWWPNTTNGTVAVQKCPGGPNSIGFIYRECFANITWGMIDLNECHIVEFMTLHQQTDDIFNLVTARPTDTVEEFNITDFDIITSDLSDLTNPSQFTLPNDLNDAIDIIATALNLPKITECLPQHDNPDVIKSVFEKLTTVISNLLNDNKLPSFTNNEQNITKAEKLLINIEQYGNNLISAYSDELQDSSEPVTLKRDNFNITLHMPNEDGLATMDGILSPDEGEAKMFIPKQVLLDEMNGGESPVVTFFMAKNLEEILPISDPDKQAPASVVMSGKISSVTPDRMLSEKVNIVFPRNNGDQEKVLDNHKCVYWKFDSENKESGYWSEDGIETMKTDKEITCLSDHLTSFMVLASSSNRVDADSERFPLIIYVGCGVAIIFLLITIIVLIALWKTAFEYKLNWIHLHLVIALLLGLILFVGGIETATNNENACTIIGVFLHYIFLVVTFWLLCEAIMIYLLISGYTNRLLLSVYFYAAIAWCLPIPIVVISAAVSHEHYGNDVMCWMTDDDGLLWWFIIPVAVMTLVSFVFLLMALFKFCCCLITNNDDDDNVQYNSAIVCGIIMLLLLNGVTWILGLYTLNNLDIDALPWIFALLIAVQGFMVLCFCIFWHKKIRDTIRSSLTKDKNDKANQQYAKTVYSNFTLGKEQQFLKDKTDRMHGNAFKNRNTFGDDQETGFVDRVDQDSINEPIEDGEFAFTNDAFDQDDNMWNYAKAQSTDELRDDTILNTTSDLYY